MKLLLLIPVLLLAGCTTVVPVTQKFPEPPGMQATKPCARLQKLEDQTTLSQVSKTVAGNYDEYWMCSIKLDAWIEWYQKQKIISQGLK